jgi:hypothetical protein
MCARQLSQRRVIKRRAHTNLHAVTLTNNALARCKAVICAAFRWEMNPSHFPTRFSVEGCILLLCVLQIFNCLLELAALMLNVLVRSTCLEDWAVILSKNAVITLGMITEIIFYVQNDFVSELYVVISKCGGYKFKKSRKKAGIGMHPLELKMLSSFMLWTQNKFQ